MGLSVDELQTIRGQLGSGRKPRVQFTDSAGQIAGQVGQVVELTDAAASDEWVVVRFGRDELPFSPGDLRVAPRGAASRKPAAPVTPPDPRRPEPEFVIDKPIPPPQPAAAGDRRHDAARGPAPRRNDAAAQSADDAAVRAADDDAAVPPITRGPASGRNHADAAAPPAARGAASRRSEADAAPLPAPRRSATRPAKPKPAASLTITVAYGGGEWTVAAAQGAKPLAKPYVIRPAEALRMVRLIDVPGVQEAVEQILAGERAEAQAQAQRLRAELAEIESKLAELGEAG